MCILALVLSFSALLDFNQFSISFVVSGPLNTLKQYCFKVVEIFNLINFLIIFDSDSNVPLIFVLMIRLAKQSS